MGRKTPLEGILIVFKACAILAAVFVFFFWFFRALDFVWDKVERARGKKEGKKEL
jgi:hypothetical protein